MSRIGDRNADDRAALANEVVDPARMMTEHLAAEAKAGYSPEAYTDLYALGHTESVDRYLRAASWEVTHLHGLLSDAARLTGEWESGPLSNLAFKLAGAVGRAHGALANNAVVEVAKEFTVVALLWKELRDRSDELAKLSGDVQRAATVTGEEAAEQQLRALAAAGERPVGEHWREAALVNFRPITARGARRVWDRVASDFMTLSSAAGKPKARRP